MKENVSQSYAIKIYSNEGRGGYIRHAALGPFLAVSVNIVGPFDSVRHHYRQVASSLSVALIRQLRRLPVWHFKKSFVTLLKYLYFLENSFREFQKNPKKIRNGFDFSSPICWTWGYGDLSAGVKKKDDTRPTSGPIIDSSRWPPDPRLYTTNNNNRNAYSN